MINDGRSYETPLPELSSRQSFRAIQANTNEERQKEVIKLYRDKCFIFRSIKHLSETKVHTLCNLLAAADMCSPSLSGPFIAP